MIFRFMSSVQHIYKQLNANEGLLYSWFSSMHTRVDILLRGESEEQLKSVVDEMYHRLDALEKIGNFYDSQSELYNVNHQAFKSPIVLSDELYEMIRLCLDYHKETLGYFDVAVQSAGYSPESISSIVLLPESRSVYFKQEGVQIDLSGFLKGYALEELRKIMAKNRLEHGLINMGNSSVLAVGNHPNGEGWKVGFGSSSATDQPVLLCNQCLTTSGNETEERSHIVSPRSGKKVEGVRRTSVVTDSGITGEVLSIAFLLATPEEQQELKKLRYTTN